MTIRNKREAEFCFFYIVLFCSICLLGEDGMRRKGHRGEGEAEFSFTTNGFVVLMIYVDGSTSLVPELMLKVKAKLWAWES